jgi:hypothetical protein
MVMVFARQLRTLFAGEELLKVEIDWQFMSHRLVVAYAAAAATCSAIIERRGKLQLQRSVLRIQVVQYSDMKVE